MGTLATEMGKPALARQSLLFSANPNAWIPRSRISPLGRIEMTAWVTGIVLRGVVHAFHGWEGHNVNQLIPDTGLDPISGYPPFKSSLCEVRKKAGQTPTTSPGDFTHE